MRVLVTGASGVFGRDICTRLVREGVDVVAMARRDVTVPGVEFVSADIRDTEAVEKAMVGADVVVHLAWAVTPLRTEEETRDVNIGGSTNVLRAMEATGCPRIVFSSSATVYGSHPDNPPVFTESDPLRPAPDIYYAAHKAEVEGLIADAGVPSVVTRSSPAAGRHLDNYEFRMFATPVLMSAKGETPVWQFMHDEDIGRFHAEAILSDRTGVVNVAPPDGGMTIPEIAGILGKKVVEIPLSAMQRVVEIGWKYNLIEMDPPSLAGYRWMPVLDDKRLREEWDFQCAWTGREALEDLARVLSRTVYIGPHRIDLPWRLAYVDTNPPRDLPPYDGPDGSDASTDAGLADAAPAELRGEFDSPIDPTYPTYSATNLSEAFPGPMTPLSLSVSLDAMLAASDGMVDFLDLRDEIAHAQRGRGAGSFGHRIYANVSVVREMAAAMPGMSPEDIDEQFLGIHHANREASSMSLSEALDSLRLLAHTGPKLLGFRGEIGRSEREAATLPASPDELGAKEDAELLAHIELLHDELCQAWNVACISNMIAAGAQSAAEKISGVEAFDLERGGVDDLQSAGALVGVRRLADLAARCRQLGSFLTTRSPEEVLAAIRPGDRPTGGAGDDGEPVDGLSEFATWFEDLVERYGHRGPGETELENEMFSDRPVLLLDSVIKAVKAPTPASTPPATRRALRERIAARMMNNAMRQREQARDPIVRLTHGLRRAVRERARRLVALGALVDPSDVFYLSYRELLASTAVGADTIARRREERKRLAALRMPNHFTGIWDTDAAGVDESDDPDTAEGSAVSGIPASPGTVRGRVRILTDVSDDLDPGDVLVAHITDTGWTPLFAFAGAVVTDVGGVLSHPAVVAREFGVPCVVGTENATRVLHDGQTVEVDGDTGTIRVVEKGA
ncbi:MAG: NAD-dependent epimerase/dehydratase family protein [Acidimicrobiia bacterium]